jgi:phosphatidylinositol glycan class F
VTQVAILGMPREHGRALGAAEMVQRAVAGFWRGTLCFQFLAVAVGAPPLSRFGHTLAWALLMASCTAVPAFCRWGCADPSSSAGAGWSRCFVYVRPQTCLEDMVVALPSYGALVGAWVGACAGPLDWEVPWQVWPIASGYGTCGGAAVGSILAGLCTALQ